MRSDLKFEDWEKFQKEVSPGNFYQSLLWAKVHQADGGRFFIWKNIKNEKLKSGALILKYNLPLKKSYLYAPLGPIGEMSHSDWFNFFEAAKQIAAKEGAFFIRFYSAKVPPQFKISKINKAPKNYFLSAGNIPPINARLDLEKSEIDLFSQLHKKTRYNIRLAQKKGLIIKNFSGENIFKECKTFLNLLKSTATKKEFSLYHHNHYQNVMEIFKNDLNLFFVYYKDRAIAAALILKWDSAAYYLYGGTDFNFRHLMASPLLHWEAIKFYKNSATKFYDFGAISTPEAPVKKWEGITRFKLSFGAKPYCLAQAYDLVINKPLYFVYNLLRKSV